MRRIHLAGGTLLGLLLSAAPAWAQFYESAHYAQAPRIVSQTETVPARPLTLHGATGQAGGGLSIDLGSDTAGDVWLAPAGAGYGVTPRLEAGLETGLLLRPFAGNQLMASVRLYGRYLLLPDLLALEVALHVPTVIANGTALEVVVPVRWRVPRAELFGGVTTLYRLGQAFDVSANAETTLSYIFSLAGTALVDIAQGVVAVGDLGFSYTHNDLGSDVGTSSNKAILLGVGAGYRITPTLFAKAGLMFPDLAEKNPLDDSYSGLSRRSLQITLVQVLDLGGGASPSSEPNPEPSLEAIE